MNRLLKDTLASKGMLVITLATILVAVIIGVSLFYSSIPLLHKTNFIQLISSSEWKPMKGKFGFFPFILGTLWVTAIAIVIALPLCILAAIYLTVYAHSYIRRMLVPFIDLLSGIPPVIFGVWGILVVVPFVGYSVLAGGIVLAVMIFPLIISILLDVFAGVPKGLTEASLSLGATQWQSVKHVLLKKALPGIIAATVLAISRAFGETIAVLMVCGNMVKVPHSMLDAGYPLTALIANNYGEMLSIPLYGAALLFAAGILFAIIFLFNAVSRIVLARIEKIML